jgi:hypothetical protein
MSTDRGEGLVGRIWPRVDHYKALAPDADQEHPIDALLERAPAIRRAHRRALDLQERIRVPDERTQRLLREFCDARLLLESQQAELAFSVGVDLGIAAGRQHAFARLHNLKRRRQGGALRLSAQMLRLEAPSSPAESLLRLLEVAWSLAAGPVPISATVRPGRSRRRRGSLKGRRSKGTSKTASR